MLTQRVWSESRRPPTAISRRVTALSPLQYQKRIRLLQARSLLIAGTGNATSVSYSVGYESPTQFTREYARLFGLPPSRDAAQLREHAH